MMGDELRAQLKELDAKLSPKEKLEFLKQFNTRLENLNQALAKLEKVLGKENRIDDLREEINHS